MPSDAAYRFSILQPAWGVLCEILEERRSQILKNLLQDGKKEHDYHCGRIYEIEETMQILEKLELEAKPR